MKESEIIEKINEFLQVPLLFADDEKEITFVRLAKIQIDIESVP